MFCPDEIRGQSIAMIGPIELSIEQSLLTFDREFKRSASLTLARDTLVEFGDRCRRLGQRKLPDSDCNLLANESVDELGLHDFAIRDCQPNLSFASQAEYRPGSHLHFGGGDSHPVARLCLEFLVFAESLRRIHTDQRILGTLWMDTMDVAGHDGSDATPVSGSLDSRATSPQAIARHHDHSRLCTQCGLRHPHEP